MENIKILIVEDNQIVALDIKRILQDFNCVVTGIVKKRSDVLRNIQTDDPSIIIMDIDLGQKVSGIDLAREIYQQKSIPIIFMSGVNDEKTIESALNTKPAYYLTKPFNKIQLKTAIQIVNEHHLKENKNLKKLSCNYSFDIKNRKLYYKGHIQKLGKKEILFLYLLVEANGKIVLLNTIENLLWDNQTVGGSAIRILVSRLRKKLECDLIETIYSHGFKLKKNFS